MSYLVLGLSHQGAPMSLLEAVALDADGTARLERRTLTSEHIVEAFALSTCNRTEVYADALTFHGALSDLIDALVHSSGVPKEALSEHLYVHYEERAISHAFRVASGLDSMAVGEAEVLHQIRESLARAQHHGHVGPALNALVQQGLRVGKKVHTETAIDAASTSLVSAALSQAERVLGPVADVSVALIGAGAMSAVAAATIQRAGVGALTIVNRSADRGARLAERVGAASAPWGSLAEVLASADLVLSCTGASGQVVPVAVAAAAAQARGSRPQVYVDLAVPHDVDREVANLEGITLVTMTELGAGLSESGRGPAVDAASDLVTAEVAAFQISRAEHAVGATVAALRERARKVVANELDRFDHRTPDLGELERAEVRHSVHRIVEKLLHTPSVRVKELATAGQGGEYARALSELFDLDPHTTRLVSTPPAQDVEHQVVR